MTIDRHLITGFSNPTVKTLRSLRDKPALRRYVTDRLPRAEAAGIDTLGWGYGQSGVVATVGLEIEVVEQLEKRLGEVMDLRPRGIIQMLDLLRPIYSKTAAYGHFGRDEPDFTWERTDRAAALKAAAGL